MPNGGPAAGLLQATRRPPVGRPPATAAATRRAERQATRRPPRKRQATRRPPGASHRQGVALIGVHFSQCQRRAGHPQGVALLYTARQFASGVVGWAYIVGPPLAGGLRVACGWPASGGLGVACGWPAAGLAETVGLRLQLACGAAWWETRSFRLFFSQVAGIIMEERERKGTVMTDVVNSNTVRAPLILALDIGTSSVRAMLFDAAGAAIPGMVSQSSYALLRSEEHTSELQSRGHL